jgi:hypothetical protein
MDIYDGALDRNGLRIQLEITIAPRGSVASVIGSLLFRPPDQALAVLLVRSWPLSLKGGQQRLRSRPAGTRNRDTF